MALQRWSLVVFVGFGAVVAGLLQPPTKAARAATVGDPLDADLRARVERLKAEAARPTDDIPQLGERLRTLWQWGNALAVARGRALPPDFTYNWAVANYNTAVRDRVPSHVRMSTGQLSTLIAGSVREFELWEDLPGAVGTLRYGNVGPLVAGEYVTLELTYTVGELPMTTGGGIVVANGWYTDIGTRVQSSDPAADGFTTVRSSNPAARFEPTAPWAEWYQWHNTRPDVCYRLADGRLEPGDTVTLVLGDRSRGSRGLKVQNWANDDVLLRTYVDLEASGHILAPAEWPALQVVGRPEIEFVNAIARPSVVKPGEPFELAVRSEDEFKNPTTGPTPEYIISNGDEIVRVIPAGRDAVAVLGGLTLSEPGVYRFQVRSSNGDLVTTSNPLWVSDDPRQRILWGDTHGHTSLADAQGSPDGYYRYGRNVARLDFLVLSEHDLWTDDFEWRALRDFAAKYLDPGQFTTIFGYEWTTSIEQGGHHNVYFRTSAGRERVSVDFALDKNMLLEGLRERYRPSDVLVIPHAHAPGDWRRGDAELQRVVEITSKHGTFEWFGNKFLANGFAVGFIGSSDNHTQRPGYVGATAQMAGLAAVYAAENTPDAIFDALRARACYATTGERILLDVDLDGGRMGQRLASDVRRAVRCRVSGTRPIDSIELVKNGVVVYGRRYLTPRLDDRPRVQVLLEASSEVFSGYRPPRPAREWTGAVEVRGARLESFAKPWFHNPVVGSFEIDRDPGDPNRLALAFSTRGRAKGVELELAGAGPDAEVVVRTEGGREAGSSGIPGEDSGGTASRLAEIELRAPLRRLLEGPVVEEQAVGRHVDRVTVQLVPDGAPLDQEFAYTDLGEARPGDYYYLRVRQVDGSMAWSSPFFVGGTDGD